MKQDARGKTREFSRRDFMRTSTAAGMATLLSGTGRLFAAGSDKVRVGLVGCGGRGSHDAVKCVNSCENVEITAMGDLFKDRLEKCLAGLREKLGEKVNVTEDTCFVGFDACEKVLACDIELVMLTEPPHFRPRHLRAAIEAGRHVFVEKPVAVDPVGVRAVIETSELAARKKLTIVAGTQMRRIAHIVELMKRIHAGHIGEILAGQVVRIENGMMDWGQPAQPDWSDMELQIRRWMFYNWLSGDFIVEQQIHNLDLINWALDAHPVQCLGMGGRQARTAPEYGNVYDHFAVEYEYPNGVRIQYMGGQIDGCTFRNDQHLVGTKGSAYFDFGNAIIEGRNPFKYDQPIPDPCIAQHADQIKAIREGTPLNEGRRVAESTLTAIMGRMSAYTGRALKWDWVMNASKLDLRPPKYEFGDLPVAPVAVPGKTELI
ncbi:MAG TPA: Gfo/Idh/MocA family oxidoreductase [Sedimentisphaerales bacterium]|nr:Gfo/Idh/MocA family oxidoreductase [Sedimentisphaerales bacterium]